MRKKKLSGDEFTKLLIDKELEIANADIRYDDIIKLSNEEQDKLKFWTKYTFKTLDEFLEWRNFYFEHVYDYFAKRESKKSIEDFFQWFNLFWGLKYDFPLKELTDYYKKNNIYKNL